MSEPAYAIDHPRGRGHLIADAQRRWWPALLPASWLYRGIADTVRRVRSLERRPTPDSVTVISVGNLDAGGSGKTPLCLHLLERLLSDGEKAAYVSRGFASRAERFGGVTVVSARPPRIEEGLRWLAANTPGLATEIGDEGAMVTRRVPAAPVAFSRDKARAVEVVAPLVAGGYVILDDAFQSWGVARDTDVVLLDARHPFRDGRLIPAGTLREEPDAVGRADVVLFGAAAGPEQVSAAVGRCAGHVDGAAAIGGVSRTLVFVDARGHDVASGGPAVALSSIARPASFEEGVIGAGVPIRRALRYPDHHRYEAADVEVILDALMRGGCTTLVTTEKDWAKLCEFDLGETDVVLARLRLDLVGEGVYERMKKPRA